MSFNRGHEDPLLPVPESANDARMLIFLFKRWTKHTSP